MPDIPHHLLEQIRIGNVALFLGAGASFDSKNSKGDQIPNGQKLADLISERFLGSGFIGQNLGYVSELAISESSLFEVQHFIAEIIKGFEPCDYHLKIPTFKWKAIFTTNYDLIIEKSYRKEKDPIQELVPIYKNTNKQAIFYKPDVLPYYKLHGCISDINDPEAPLILTPDQFIDHKSKRERLFIDLQEISYDFPVLFVGFGMADPDIRAILNNLDKTLSSRTRSYMVGPNINLLEEKMWDAKKISTIKMPFSQFINEIDNEIDKTSRKLSIHRPKTKYPIYDKFRVPIDSLIPSETFLTFIENDIEYVHANLSSPNTDPKEFYKGHFDNWDPIIKNLDIIRKIKDGILWETVMEDSQHESDKQFFYLLKGNAGSGKSVLLKRLAFDSATTLDKFCIFLKDGAPIRPQQFSELFNYVKERIYLFIDNVSLLEDEVIYLLNKCKKEKVKITIIAAERANVWNTECQNLLNYLTESYHIKYLPNSEIEELLMKLERFHCLGTLERKTHEERIEAFSEKAGRELLVALYEATNSKPFEVIIFDEYNTINDKRAQSLYLTVSIFHRLGCEARSGFISRVHDISFHEFKEKLFKPLEGIVFDRKNKQINDFVYITRNRLIAEIIFERVLTTSQDRFDEYIRVLNNLNIDYDSDRVAFLAITNARKLLKVFPDAKMIRLIFDVAQFVSKDDPKLLQQRAIFEMNSEEGNMNEAEKYLKQAYDILPGDQIISHSFAEMLYKKAERAKLNNEFFSYIEECVSLSSSIISKNPKNSHPYHTVLKALILKFKRILELEDVPSIERTLKDIEKSFAIARQIFPNEEFILETESSFNLIINQRDNAKALMEKAFKTNKASPYLALRLASFYEKEKDIGSALNVIKESLELSAVDKDLNFKYGMLLEKEPTPNYEDIKYYLRRSFTMEDSRFQAQFWYGRACYATNDFVESKKIFEYLSQANVSPEIRRTPFGLLKYNNQVAIFEGTIITIELSFGFVKRDGFGDSIYFYRFENEYVWENFKRGSRISFKIGFNYRGPMALDIKILD